MRTHGAALLAVAAVAAAAPAAAGADSVRFGLRAERGTLERTGGGRFELTLRGMHPRAIRIGARVRRAGDGLATKRLLAGWRARGFHADRPHALLAITAGTRERAAHAVELGPPRVRAGGRRVTFRVRAVDAERSPVPDVTRALDDGRFGRALLVIHDRRSLASGAPCGYAGQLDLFAVASQPSAYLEADGRELAVANYPALFALIGSRFGGDGVKTFKLPEIVPGPGLAYRLCVDGTMPPRQPDGTEGRCAPGSISLQAQPYQPAGWTLVRELRAAGVAYYACAGRQSAGPCFVGQLGLFTSGSLPSAYLPADGRKLRITQYQPLYYMLETTFGGDGKETFALPDLPGAVPDTEFGVCAAGRWPS